VVPTYQTAGYHNPEDCGAELGTDNIPTGYVRIISEQYFLHPGSFLLIHEWKWTIKIKFSSKISKILRTILPKM
jgi:hypothetical protein